MPRIYLDHNATSPARPEVLQAIGPYFRERFGNPSSLHRFGQEAHRAVARAREQVAALVGVEPAVVVFTASGTEADNLALRGALAAAPRPAHVVTSAVEHPAVLRTCQALAGEGVRVSYVPVDGEGRVDPAAVEAALTPETALVSVMLANNDVGTLQPVAELAARVRARCPGALLHTDAVQAAGRIAVDVRALGVDLLSLSAHKLGGIKGAAALIVQPGARLRPLLTGGAQERGRRAGTEDVPAIVGLGQACALAADELGVSGPRLAALRDRLAAALATKLPTARVNGAGAPRLPNTLNVSFPGIEGELLLLNLDLLGIAVSTGSACASGTQEPSHVLLAMGLSPALAAAAVRFSLGPETTAAEVDAAAAATVEIVTRLRASGAAPADGA